MRAWIKHGGLLQLRDVPEPTPRPDELLVQVETVSLNRGEVRAARLGAEGVIPGWDVVGRVLSGEGHPPGTRVAAILRGAAWAERAAVPLFQTAAVPDDVSNAVAATLPLAGLTALRAFAVAGPLLGRRVLITGASGGVGMLAAQLARIGGASVTTVRTASGVEGLFDVILESVGGASLAAAIAGVASGGTIVSIGNSAEEETTFNARTLFAKGGASLYGLLIFEEVDSRRIGGRELGHLLELARRKELQPVIGAERDWTRLETTLNDLAERKFDGKAVLHVAG
jgi:NADPH2:quinone reductase